MQDENGGWEQEYRKASRGETNEPPAGTDITAATAETNARRYVLDRCGSRLYIDRSVVRSLTGWDGPRICRFVGAVQDAFRLSEGRRPRGRPRKRF